VHWNFDLLVRYRTTYSVCPSDCVLFTPVTRITEREIMNRNVLKRKEKKSSTNMMAIKYA